ncbi:hypothetical protein Q7A53_06290 [Halobacillus rhizosphaerae]|uniref:hypothetical protein n=1 Tax=Halobacillus rhizosphaerae TaxID=3064889 RepID=UPI00398A5572
MKIRDLNIGTMNASKSAHLIISAYRFENRQDKKVLAFKPKKNTRDDDNFITSRALGEKLPAITISEEDVGVMAENVWKHRPDVLMIDELQFFTVDQIDELALISLTYDVDIYAYGLMISYNSTMFEATKRAVERGFRIVNIEMQCDYCRDDATHHILYIDGQMILDDSGIKVEDNKNADQVYKSVCYACYQKSLDKNNK